MKKISLLFVTALFSLVTFTSCEDLLEEKNYGNPTVDSMMGSEENVVLLVGQAYERQICRKHEILHHRTESAYTHQI